MKKTFVKLLSVLLISCFLFGSFALAGGQPAYKPGDVDNDAKISASDARIILRVSVGLEELVKIENVAGYPKKDGTKTLHAFFINGARTNFDVYTYDNAPEAVYAPPCLICWSFLKTAAVSCSRSENDINVAGAFGARINGYVVSNHTGVGSTKVGNNTYPDLVPEYYHNDYHCSLLLFVKTLNAKITFSPDGSAVYMTTGAVNKASSACDDFDLSVDGTLKYKGDAEQGTVTPEKPTEEPTTQKPSGGKTICPTCYGTGRKSCYACGGSGKTFGYQTTMQYDPLTGMMMSKQVMVQVNCSSCGGLGGSICTSCAGSGYWK